MIHALAGIAAIVLLPVHARSLTADRAAVDQVLLPACVASPLPAPAVVSAAGAF